MNTPNGTGATLYSGGASLRFQIIILCLLVLFPQACARHDPAVESLKGSEPQRLYFGAPPEVLRSFVQKMKICWFNGPSATLAGYRFETGEREAGEGGSAEPFQNVMIYSGGSSVEAFEVEFHKYNENTLIGTRNISLPPELMAKLQRDIQLWVLTSRDCSA
jgi:hypothetical protein